MQTHRLASPFASANYSNNGDLVPSYNVIVQGFSRKNRPLDVSTRREMQTHRLASPFAHANYSNNGDLVPSYNVIVQGFSRKNRPAFKRTKKQPQRLLSLFPF